MLILFPKHFLCTMLKGVSVMTLLNLSALLLRASVCVDVFLVHRHACIYVCARMCVCLHFDALNLKVNPPVCSPQLTFPRPPCPASLRTEGMRVGVPGSETLCPSLPSLLGEPWICVRWVVGQSPPWPHPITPPFLSISALFNWNLASRDHLFYSILFP